MAELSHSSKVMAAVVAVAGVTVVAFALLVPEQSSMSSDHMGMYGPQSSYGAIQVALMLVGTIIAITALVFIFVREDYEPIIVHPQGVPQMALQVPQIPQVTETLPEEGVPAVRGEDEGRHNYLVLRLLTGDERTVFKAIMDSGGQALQKDLILRTKMSNAKVSRVLDRLQQKDVISKERYGATNMIKISRKD